MKSLTLIAVLLAGCAPAITCYNEHGHHPHDHHPACEIPTGVDRGSNTITPPPELDNGHKNNGFGSGNQDASGNSEFHNGAENKGGNN